MRWKDWRFYQVSKPSYNRIDVLFFQERLTDESIISMFIEWMPTYDST